MKISGERLSRTEDGAKEVELLERLAAGDEKAFNTIYRSYNSVIFSAAIVYLKDIDEARDIVQQVFVKLWEKRVMATNIENFQNYIIVTARNLIYDQFRKKSAETKVVTELAKIKYSSPVQTGANSAETKEYARIFDAAIGQLPPQQKKVYQMVQEEQLSYKEIAATMNLSVFTVKSHLEHARRSIRNYVAQNLLN
jgi:RNA polymerase sigma-70 factor (family 1)